MLLGIDGNEANEVRPDLGAPAGVNVYAFELIKAIYTLQDEWKDRHKVVVYLKREPSTLLPRPTKHFRYKVLPGRGLWVLSRLIPYLFKSKKGVERPDVMFSPSHYTPFLAPMPKVCSIMDLGYLANKGSLKKKDFWQLKYWTAISLATATHIFAISKSTKRDVIERYPNTHDKVTVTYLGYDHAKYNKDVINVHPELIKRVLNKYSIGSDYLLYLGVLKPSKNVEGLIEAWSKIVNKYESLCLVIAGKKGWMYESIFKTVKKHNLEKNIIFTDYLPEDEKPYLIAGARLFVLPSFWEGFGHDILHALACGVPFVGSSAGSIPEVAGDAGVYFNPGNVDDISEKIDKVLSLSKVDYNELVEKSLSQAKKFSWEDSAKKTLKVLESIK